MTFYSRGVSIKGMMLPLLTRLTSISHHTIWKYNAHMNTRINTNRANLKTTEGNLVTPKAAVYHCYGSVDSSSSYVRSSIFRHSIEKEDHLQLFIGYLFAHNSCLSHRELLDCFGSESNVIVLLWQWLVHGIDHFLLVLLNHLLVKLDFRGG